MNESVKRYCIMPSCKGEKMDLVHKFPRNDARAKEWLEIINLPELADIPLAQIRKSKFICTRHFAPEAYKHHESRSLNINAVPSRNLECLETLDHIINRERRARNGSVVYKKDSDDLSLATKFFEVDEHDQETEIMEKITTQRKNLRQELNKIVLFPLGKRKKVVHEEEQPEWEQTCVEPNRMEIDISDVIAPLPLDEMFEEILEDAPVLPDELITNSTPKLDYLEIMDEKRSPGESPRLNYFWLRDHCQCEKCYDKETSQRKINLIDINLDIRPLEYDIQGDRLHVIWPDSHESFYSLDFLYKSQYVVQRPNYEKSHVVLWNHETISTMKVANIDLSDLLCTESAVKTVLNSLIKYGVAFINKVPTNLHSTEMTITRMFPLMKTFKGQIWTSGETKDFHDDFSKQYLPPHNDTTYFSDSAGLKILHCIQHKGEGGEIILVDGFNIISELKKDHPEMFQRLTEYQILSKYVTEEHHHRHLGPIIKLDTFTNNPEQIRFNMNDRATHDTIPFDKIQEFYSDFHFLSTQIQEEANEWRFKLNPGTVMIFDNWRILHGHTEYTENRVMIGAYVQRTDFMSAARVAGIVS